MHLSDRLTRRARGLRHTAHRRGRLIAAASGAVVGVAAVATAVARRRHRETVELGDPGVLAAETAQSVHNAAKGTIIGAVRSAEQAHDGLVTAAVWEAMQEAARSGTDITSVAVGVVEGAAEVAHLVGVKPHDLASLAARAAVDAAAAQGDVAGQRVHQLLTPHRALRLEAAASTSA